MSCGTKAIRTLVDAAMVISSLTLPAYPESIGLGKKPGNSGYDPKPPTENHPKMDENAYKSALERTREPAQKYDPWAAPDH